MNNLKPQQKIDIFKNLFRGREDVSEIELKVFDKLIRSLESQTGMLLNEKLPKEVRENIMKFFDSLKDIIKIRNEKFPNVKFAINQL